MRARGGAQHGQNSESYAALEAEWRRRQAEVSTLDEAIEFLRQCHRRAPFLFFNGNTFADVGRTIVDFVFAELPTTRRREIVFAGPITSLACLITKPWRRSSTSFLRQPIFRRATESKRGADQ
jgi:hypothetical protein